MSYVGLLSHQRHNYLSVSMMYDILHGHYNSLNFSDYCSFNTSCTRAHSFPSFHLSQPLILIDIHFL